MASISETPQVTVVGAGIIGLATAYELARAGRRVRLVDPAPISGATHHAGGMLAPAAEVVFQQNALFPLMAASARRYPGLLAQLARDTPAETGYHTEGTIVVAGDRADLDFLTQLRGYQNQHGMAVEPITVREARRLEPALSPRIRGAVAIPGDTQVMPRLLARAFADACRRLGVVLERRAYTAEELRAARSAGREQVVLANGLGTAALLGEGDPKLALRPVYGDILRLSVPPSLRPLLTRVVRGVVEGRPVYLIPRVDDTIAIGATSREDDRPTPRAGDVYDLLRDAVALVPGIEECGFVEVTTGARPGTPDDLPYIGRLDETVVVSTGYFRHGILLTALGSHATAQLVLGEAPDEDVAGMLASCRLDRHTK